jgi:uncharacterized protein
MSDVRLFFRIADELNIDYKQVAATVILLDEGSTVPFISRYRKEITGSLDEVAVLTIKTEIERLRALEERKATVIKSIREQGKLTPELEKQIEEAETLSKVEDLYLPYRPKRKTRAGTAREKGLEPLADLVWAQNNLILSNEAEKFINAELGVKSVEDALQGARDIIAEKISEDALSREKIRQLFKTKAMVRSKLVRGKEEEASKYEDYFDFEEALSKIPSHRMLALRRGEKEDFLIVDIRPEEKEALDLLENLFVRGKNQSALQVKEAIADGYQRLLQPSMEAEMRVESKKQAEEKAIQVFADNLKELLLASPLGQKCILALDPGFRTGCKAVVLDRQGKLMEDTVIYPHEPQRKTIEAENIVLALCARYPVEAIAIGNGTASKETENFIRKIDVLPKEIQIVVVNESGASVYSASEVAREEFPDKDVTVRGAVSIGRRLADPLAELVKIDPKSIGVGQYQHDVDQSALKDKLDEVVVSCVNRVGVELNTASKQLLTYVSGLGPQLAQNIVNYRNENGPFKTRKDLLKVNRMGEKVFEQAAGFLRINNGTNPLDQSAVHPESYAVVEKMASDLNATVEDLMKKPELRKKIRLSDYVSNSIGLPTLNDILAELDKPGRDPRKMFEAFSFATGIDSPEDLRPGMKLPGIVTNVTNFGAFVDIGVHQDGLVHISQLSDSFVDDPNKIVKVQQKVDVTVIEVDLRKKRIALSMKSDPDAPTFRSGSPSTKAKEPDYDTSDMNAALNALKRKFGK